MISGLMEPGEDVRLESTRKMIEYIGGLQKNKASKTDVTQELHYTMKRLVRGLASPKNTTRPGFSTALTQILRMYPKVSIQDVVDVMSGDKGQLKVNTNDSKREQGQTIIGQVMVYMALIQANRLRNADEKDVQTIVSGLQSLMKTRSYVEHICSYGLAEVISQISSKLFSKVMYKSLEESLQSGWDACTANRLLLILHAAKAQPRKIDAAFLTRYWGSATLICVENLPRVSEIVLNSTSLHPVTHPVVTVVMDRVVHDDRLLRALWNAMVTEKFPSLTLAQRYLVFHMLHYALTSVPVTSSRLQILFSSHVMTTLMKTVANKNDLFYSVSQKTLNAVCQPGNGTGLQFELLQIFMTPPGSILFDSITHTQTLATLIHQLTEEDAHKYFKLCLEHLHCEKRDSSSLGDDVRQRLAIHHLSLLASCPSLHQRPLQSDVIKLLFLHSFFIVEKSCKEIEHCERGPMAAVPDKSVLQLMKTTFVKTVDHVTSVSQSQRTEGMPHDHMNFGPMLDLVKYIQSLLDSEDVVTLREGNVDTVKAAWTKLKKAVDALEEKTSKSHEDIAFLHLYLQFSHQLFSDAEATVDVLDDLLQCHKKLNTKRRKSVSKPDSEPEWVDVMTDMFLQLLSRNSHHVRRIVSVSYSLLAPHCTPASVHLMLDVLKSEGGDDEMVDFEDDSDGEEEAMDEEGDESSNHGNEEDESDESSDDEDDLVENGGVDEALKEALKQALGEAKADSDQEESESDMSDTEMFKLDDALGKAFKGHLSKKKAEQDQRQQLMHFKIRVLDLISATVKHTYMKEGLVIDILTNLVHLLCVSSKQKELKQLVAKISETISVLCKIRKIDIDHSCRDVDRVVDTLKEFLKASQKELAVSEDIKRACIFLVRLCTTDHTQPSPRRTRANKTKQEAEHKTTEDLCQAVQTMLRTSLLDYFYKRDPHLDPALYTQLFTGQTEFMVPLLADLVTVVGDESVRIFCRSQACGMLNVAFNKKLADDTREDWKEFGQKLHSALEKALVTALEGDLKPKAVQVLLLCLNKYDLNFQQIISQEDLQLQERLLASVQNTKHKNKDIKKATASLQNMINRLKVTSPTKGTSSQQNGAAKKRRAADNPNDSSQKGESETSSPSPTKKKKKKVNKK